MPEAIRFDLDGHLRPNGSAKDITLRILQLYGEDVAVYQGVEFAGPLISELSMDERLVLSNMVIKFGGRTGYIQPNDITVKFLEGRREAGIAAVVAPSFGRLFTRNCFNLGVPVIVVPGIDKHVETWDDLAIELDERTLVNMRNGHTTQFAPMAPEALRLVADGGIFGYTRRILAERKAAAARG